MLATYNVIDLMSESRPAIGVKAVLTAILRAEDDFSPYGFRQIHDARVRICSARAFATRRICSS